MFGFFKKKKPVNCPECEKPVKMDKKGKEIKHKHKHDTKKSADECRFC